jgi:hypothetical protein
LVVEGHHSLGRPSQVGHDETNARIEFTRIPLDLGHHKPWLFPALRLMAEAAVVASHLVCRSPNRALEQTTDPLLQDPIGRQPDRIAHALGFMELTDFQVGEGRGAAEIAALHRVSAGDHRVQHCAPTVGSVHIARPWGTSLHVAKLIEHE